MADAPWMSGGFDPSQYGGLTNLGLSLLAHSNDGGSFGAILGRGALGAQQNYQDTQIRNLQLQQMSAEAAMAQQKMSLLQQAAQQYMGGQAPSQAQPPSGAPPNMGAAPGQFGFSGGPSPAGGDNALGAMPASQPQQQPQGAPSWLNPPSPNQMRSQPIGGIDPNYYRTIALVNGKDPLTADKEIQDRQFAESQQQFAPVLSKLETIIKSDKPSQYISADPSLKQAWNTIAPQLGFTKPSDFTDQNIRTALTYAHNQISSAMKLPTLAPNVPLQQGRDAASGLNYEVDPVSGKRTYAPVGPNVISAAEKQKLAIEQARFAQEQSRFGVPEGYEKAPTPDNPSAVRPIPNGPHDPLAVGAGMGNRGEVMFNRVVNAGNSAAESAKNISELPLGTSSGWLGYGSSHGTGILSSIKSGLTKGLSSQETQDYNVMLSGVSRNLAALETSGLAPGGSLTHSMDALAISPGDTRMTVLRKQAEMRQIIETNLQSNLVNPKIPEPQKQFVRDILDKTRAAIPYTNADVTKLEQSTNPKATIMDFAKSTVAKPLAPGEAQSLGQFTVTRIK